MIQAAGICTAVVSNWVFNWLDEGAMPLDARTLSPDKCPKI
jgi:hypothetical protein